MNNEKYNLTKYPNENILKPIANQYNIPISMLSQLYQIMEHWDTEQQDFYIDCIDGKKTWDDWKQKYGHIELDATDDE